jgi:hypothetical protein
MKRCTSRCTEKHKAGPLPGLYIIPGTILWKKYRSITK